MARFVDMYIHFLWKAAQPYTLRDSETRLGWPCDVHYHDENGSR